MGEHKGWTVEERNGKHLVRVWQPSRGKYVSKMIRTGAKDANDYGRKEAGKIAAGVRVAEKFPTRTADLAKDFVAEMGQLDLSDDHCDETERLLDSLAKEVPDLGASNAGTLISSWLAGLRLVADPTTPVSPATRNRHLVMVRALCNWAIRWKRLSDDPTSPIRMASVPDYLPPVFTLAEIRQCLAKTHWEVVRKGNDPRDPYHLLFATLIYSGMRFGELTGFRPALDLDWSGRMLALRNHAGSKIKRKRERLIPLQDELAEIWKPYRHLTGQPFAARKHNGYRSFRAFMERAGVTPGDRTPHSCRHSYAGLMTASGVPGQLLAAYLGHTSVATTMEYTKHAMHYVRNVEGWKLGELRFAVPAAPPGEQLAAAVKR